ncbi:MAG TPA: hypothetical protein VIS05_05835 [Ilumatobacter sp.]
MIFAAVDSTGYKLMLLLHLVAAVTAFGPLFLYPGLRKAGETATIATTHMRMTLPALVLVWVFGMGLAGMSDGVFEMSETWLTLAIAVWAVMVAVSWFLIKPAITDTSEAANAKLSAGIGITHLGLIASLVLMIWKPGQ